MTLPPYASDGQFPEVVMAAERSHVDTTQKDGLAQLRIRLLRHARHAVHDPHVAEDLVQDTLLAVTQQEASYRGDATLLTWSTAILRNKVADWYRSPDRRRIVQRDLLSGNTDIADYASSDAAGDVESAPSWKQPENREEQRQMMSILERCIGCLPAQIGKVFMMREWLGFDTAEICERLHISQASSRKILQRARSALRVCMLRNWIGGKPNA